MIRFYLSLYKAISFLFYLPFLFSCKILRRTSFTTNNISLKLYRCEKRDEYHVISSSHPHVAQVHVIHTFTVVLLHHKSRPRQNTKDCSFTDLRFLLHFWQKAGEKKGNLKKQVKKVLSPLESIYFHHIRPRFCGGRQVLLCAPLQY